MKTIPSLILLLSLLPLLRPSPLTLLPSVEQFHTLSKSKGVNLQYFTMTIQEKLPDVDLSIMVRPLDEQSDPDIFISSSNQMPDSFSNSDIACTTSGMDICTIEEKNITKNSVFYIGVKCFSECSFAIKAEYSESNSFSLSVNPNTNTMEGIYSLEFDSNAAKIVKFSVPKNDLNLERILIKTQITSVSQLNETFSIYLREGNTPPTSSRYSHKGMESWNEGQSILLTKEEDGEDGFCNSGCNYTLLLYGPEDSRIRITVQGYNNIVKTKLNQNFQDMVFRDQNITYELNVDSTVSLITPFKDVNLILTLTVYSGNPDLYVHYDGMPTKLEKYQWKSTENIKESLIITAKEREALGCSNSKFYITVYGKFTSTFSLWIGTSHSFAYLGFGVAQTGSVINREIINYRLFLPNSYDNMNISLTLNANSGNPDLYIKRCILNDTDNDWRRAREEREKCKISLEDVKGRYGTGFKPYGADLFLFSDNVGGKDFVKFFHNAADCVKMEGVTNFNVNKCFYVVGIHGNSANSNESRYSLLASYNQAHLILSENTPLRSKGELGLYSYFKFYLPSNEGIDLLRFQITEISGRVAVYVSKKNRYPTSDSYEKAVFSHWGSLSYEPTEGNLGGNYYLGVLSETASTYSILPVVVRKGGKGEKETVTILYEGSPQHYSYVFKREEKYYFAFNLHRNVSLSGLSDVFVHLTPIKGDFNMFVLNLDMADPKIKDPRPSQEFFHFKSSDNGVLIRNTSANFKENGKYLVYVEPKNQDEIENRLQEFVIQYSTWGSMKTLSTHHPFVDVLSNDSFAYYRCEAHRGDESIEISVSSKTYNPFYKTLMRVFFSFTSENPFPDEKKNDFTTVIQNSIWILVENSDLRTNCPFLFDENKLNYTKQCVFYMSIQTYKFPLDISYGINIKRNTLEKGGKEDLVYSYLHDDTIADIQYNVSQKNGNMTFLIYKLQKLNQPIQISIKTQVYGGISFTLLGNIDSFKKIDSPLTLNNSFPKTKSESTFTEKFYYSLSTTIKPSLFKSKSCFSEKEGCGLFLTLIANEAYSQLNRLISVQVTQKILYIAPGVPTKGFVNKGEIKYYLLKVNEDNTELVISVTPLDNGDPDLVVNRGRNSDWPTDLSSEWMSKNLDGDQLKIKHKSSETDPDKNYYIIGVIGKKKCEFVLNVLVGNFRIREVYSNFPSEIILKQKEQTLLVFQNNQKDQGLRMIFSREYGDFLYAISLIRNKSDDYVDRIPSFSKKINYFISNLGQRETYAVSIDSSDPNYCSNCTYFVLIQAEKDTVLTFLITSGKEGVYLQNGKSFKDWVESKKTNTYYSDFYYEVKKVIINVVVYQGRVKVYVAPTKEVNSSNAEITKLNEKDNLIKIEYDYSFSQKGPTEEYSYYKPNVIGVLVEGLSSANYTISIRPEGKQRTLKYGIHEYLFLVYGEAQYVNFHSPSDFSEDRHFSLSFNGLNGFMNSSIEALEFEFYVKETKKGQVQVTKLEESKYTIERSVEGYFITLRASKGDFEVKVTLNEKKFYRWIYVVLNFDGIDTVSPDHTYFGKLQGTRTQFYQLLTQQNEKVLVEVFQCAGRVKLLASGTQSNILNHINDLKNELDSPLASESHHISLFTTQSSKLAISNVYLGIKYVEGYLNKSSNAQKESAKYVLRTHFLSSLMQTPYEVFFPGEEGAVFYNLRGGYFNFYASPLICEGGCKDRLMNSLKGKIKNIKYYIAISDDNLYADAFTKCGVLKETMKSLLYQEFNLDAHAEGIQVNFPFKEDLFLDHHDYYVKIVASIEVQETYNVQPYTFFYKTLQFYPGYLAGGQGEGGALPWILTIVIIAFFLAVGVACWVFRRYKIVEKQLNYELQDVRNVAGMKSPSGFGTLMTDG